ncbi:hypothetical protein RF11_04823 [Thelohanellus kitauei]|uniref:MULE transposase domain-containing protein n=1 Tax=Thelohanellus kitauei TaxID=669202 RepID=A0A0C2NGZ4_THEKT|nr:hypothetical protein RF11_04823 [Thelohanellus kitauei]
MPSYDSLQRTIQNIRQRRNTHYRIPTSTQDFIIPDEFKVTNRGIRFLLDDTQITGQRVIIFSTDDALNILSQTNSIFFDGTFSVVPDIFYQLFVLHGFIHGQIFPLVYVLMERKTKESYLIVWRKLQEYITENLTSAMCDFEIASIQAFNETFPQIPITGCYYHFCQSIYRGIQRFGLVTSYNESQNIRIHLRMLSALAFCPPQQVSNYYEILEDQLNTLLQSNSIRQFLDYFEETYIGRFRRTGRDEPRFPIVLWNQRLRVIDHLPHTNNNVEGWHRAFSSIVDASHPSIYTFLKHLKNKESLVSARIAREQSININDTLRERSIENQLGTDFTF